MDGTTRLASGIPDTLFTPLSLLPKNARYRSVCVCVCVCVRVWVRVRLHKLLRTQEWKWESCNVPFDCYFPFFCLAPSFSTVEGYEDQA